MTDRERWTIYPLLFLALGIAVKDKIFREVTTDNVLAKKMQCNSLIVTDPQGAEQVLITATPNGGLIRTRGAMAIVDHSGREQVLLSSTSNGGLIRTRGAVAIVDESGHEQALLSSVNGSGFIRSRGTLAVTDQEGREQVLVSIGPAGGQIQTHGTHNGLITLLGYTDQFGGLMFLDERGALRPGSVLVPAIKKPPTPTDPEGQPTTDSPPHAESAPEDAPAAEPESPADKPTGKE